MENHLLHTYSQLPIQFERGEGAWLIDTTGKRYLDAYSGIAVTGLGHNHPAITRTIQNQAAKIIHTSNLVEIYEQIELGNLLASLSGMDSQVCFINSGAEAVETAIKLTRLYGHSKNITTPKIIVMEGAFHGRTMATISAGANAKAREGFDPLLTGFVRVPFNDANAIDAAIKLDNEIVAVLIEPIQGESGINVPSADYLNKVRDICDQYKILMILDEIQSSMARTGKFFCFEHNNILPDVITMAKGLANGVPIGACIIRKPFCDLFKPGSHGSTFGGNPLSCATGIATLQVIKSERLHENAAKQGKKIIDGLTQALNGNPHVKEVRGKGLMIGVELDRPSRDILPIALEQHIIFNIAGTNVLRIMPPLIINDQETKQIIETIPKVIDAYYANSA